MLGLVWAIGCLCGMVMDASVAGSDDMAQTRQSRVDLIDVLSICVFSIIRPYATKRLVYLAPGTTFWEQ